MTHRGHSPHTFEERLARLEELRQAAVHTNPEAEEKQHARGKYTARERVEKLLDPGSFNELHTFLRRPTPARSTSQTRSPATARSSSGCRTTARGATRSSPAMARSTAAGSACSA